MVIETKEDFDHWFDQIFNNGKEQWIQDGKATALAMFYYIINRKFDDETIINAQIIAGKLAKAEAIVKMKKEER